MFHEDEQNVRLAHQALFLFVRGLASGEMQDCEQRLHTLEALCGKDPSKLDARVRDRLLDELEEATLDQLTKTGLSDEWQRSWDRRVALADLTSALETARV